jgi:predicted alpha/beta-fold hydrolase
MQNSIVTDSRGTKYREVNGTFYHAGTSDEIVAILEQARRHNWRLTFDFGDVATGKSWGEVNDVSGYIGRSTGSIKIPLLIHNTRSYGGGALLDDCIIGIKHSNRQAGGVLYQWAK